MSAESKALYDICSHLKDICPDGETIRELYVTPEILCCKENRRLNREAILLPKRKAKRKRKNDKQINY